MRPEDLEDGQGLPAENPEEQVLPQDDRGLRERFRDELRERCASIPEGRRIPLLVGMLMVYVVLLIFMLF